MKEDKVIMYVAIISIIIVNLLGLIRMTYNYIKLEEETNNLETELIVTKTILESYTDVGFGEDD